jgi:Flp pilus assembly protein TadG
MHRRRERGGAAVEFAIVLPLFCALVFGIVDYGWYYYQRFTLAAAVRDGIRYGVTIPATATSPNDPYTLAQKRAASTFAAASSLTVIWGPSLPYGVTAIPTKSMTLQATISPYKPLIGFVPLPTSMTYSMTMLLEVQ